MFICLVCDSMSPARPGVLAQVARACSPRVEPHGDHAVLCDGSGLTRVIGMPAVIAEELRRMAWAHEVGVRVAMAGSKTAAWLLAHVRPGATLVPAGEERQRLARLPLSSLTLLPDALLLPNARPSQARARQKARVEALATLDRWGLVLLEDLARLPRADVLARLGVMGARLHQAACGEDAAPLVPQDETPRFIERLELEWPVEGLEPLAFVLARGCDALAARLERADRGAVGLTTRLTLVDKTEHVRTVTLPTPMRDAKTLRALILLDLESHPAPAGIDVVELECAVTPGRIIQGSLLTYPTPVPEQVATLIARLNALAGDTRVGSPAVVDSHNARTTAMHPFAPGSTLHSAPRTPHPALSTQHSALSTQHPALSTPHSAPSTQHSALSTQHSALSTQHSALSTQHSALSTQHSAPSTALRRHPMPIRVRAEKGRPVEVALSASVRAAAVTTAAGPWRTSGHWWTDDADAWDRDEWDVALETGAVYRLSRDRHTDRWMLEGEVD